MTFLSLNNLAAGAVGGLGTAALSYWVRILLDRRTKREEERLLAYIHYIKVSRLRATVEVLKILLGAYKQTMDGAIAKLREERGPDADLSHLIMALIHFYTRKMKRTPALDEQLSNLRKVVSRFKDQLTELLDYRISVADQAKLPKSAVLHYQLFAEAATNLKHGFGIVEMWLDRDPSITAANLHELWRYAVYFYKRSEDLAADLRAMGRISDSNAQVILNEQKLVLSSPILEKFKADPKIEAVLKHLEATVKDEDPPASPT